MTVFIPPPQQQATEKDRFTEPWFRAFDDMTRAINAPSVPTYTVATVPTATTPGRMIFVSNEAGGATLAFSDGTNWRRATDLAIVS